ncbi:Lauroyl/myristoyl acyltransferase [Bernardetia litoralis DSM 6794]|uniref:Lauroyl/myristoyl acyltransferase n=1 Tax=Bernardetia litoralis (strain ATCC 23117 / DSM 6794 / NBRC 15988 / NCIMB 1366 / Fx l1 / Sio-4) TaxID=880071 RepID=I4AK82_BERLS|nr:Lauroyl/myristoyl acyltransferase [Bernardetia litoralis]AFM04367.1 Lauroyl/myristoyl acyltransferase [Bernardetia litoralis DSM 6794]
MNPLSSSQNQSILFEELEKLKNSFSFENKEIEKEFYKKNSYLFATTSASLFRLLPQIPYSKHKSIFEKLFFNLQLLNLEEKYVENFAENFEIIDTENSLNKAQQGQPFLFCCFHTGAYSIIPALLANNYLDFGFLSNKTLTEKKGTHFLEVHRNYCKKHNIKSTIQLINVEENKGIWKAIRMLKEGKSLIVYADGNTGSNYSKKESQNTVRVNFLGENLQVRQGIAFLSYMCNIPIVSIISSRDFSKEKPNLKRKYTLLPAIYPPNFTDSKPKKDKISKEEFAEQTMQKLYFFLEKEITKEDKISEWEGWIFVNKFFEQLQKPISRANIKNSIKINTSLIDTKKAPYIFNEERFALIESAKNTLFDKFTYRFFPASDLLYEIITYFSVPKKLYLFDETQTDNEQLEKNSNSSIFIHSNSKLQLSKTIISVSILEKLIEKKILIQYK